MVKGGNILDYEKRREILKILVENGRISLVDIAKRLGITHVAVSKHLKQMISNSVIRIQANVNPKKLKLYLVLVLLEVDEEALKEIVFKFRECPRIILLTTIIGGFNIAILMIAENEEVLKCISTTCSVRVLKGIRRSEVYTIADLVKPEYLPIKLPFPKDRDRAPCGRNCSMCEMYRVNRKCLGCPATKYYRGNL